MHEHRKIDIRPDWLGETDLPPQQSRAPPVGETTQILAFEQDLTTTRPIHARSHTQQRCLALCALCQDRDELARIDIQRSIRKHRHDMVTPTREAHRDIPQREQHAHHPVRCITIRERGSTRWCSHSSSR